MQAETKTVLKEQDKLIKRVSNARTVTTVDITIAKGTVDKVFLELMSNGNTPRFIPKFTHTKEEIEKLGFDTELSYTLEFPQGVELRAVLEKLNSI